jgi:hypothetical protein
MKQNMKKIKKKRVNIIFLNNSFEILIKKLMMKYLEPKLELLLLLLIDIDQLK